MTATTRPLLVACFRHPLELPELFLDCPDCPISGAKIIRDDAGELLVVQFHAVDCKGWAEFEPDEVVDFLTLMDDTP